MTWSTDNSAGTARESLLCPTLEPGQVVIMGPSEARTQRNNFTIHHNSRVKELLTAQACEVLYLPTYSPDFNPTTHLFAKIKAFIRKLRPNEIMNQIAG